MSRIEVAAGPVTRLDLDLGAPTRKGPRHAAHRIDDLTVDRRAALVAALPVLEQIALPD